jgi:hypothetical protein
VNENRHISIDYISTILDISHGIFDTVLKQDLGLTKIASRWVLNQLTREPTQRRVDVCLENLQKFERNTWILCDIVIGDETWICQRKIRSKQQSKIWITREEISRTEMKRQAFEEKTMFFSMTNGPILVHQIPSRTSINATYYRYACLKSLIKKLHKKRPSSKENHVKLHHHNARPHMNNIVFNYLREEKNQIYGSSTILIGLRCFRFLVI